MTLSRELHEPGLSQAVGEAVLLGQIDTFHGFAERFNRLIEDGPGPKTNAAIAAAVEEAGGHLAPSMVSLLRRGERTNPGYALIGPLSQAFDVPVAYWFSEAVATAVWAERRPAKSL